MRRRALRSHHEPVGPQGTPRAPARPCELRVAVASPAARRESQMEERTACLSPFADGCPSPFVDAVSDTLRAHGRSHPAPVGEELRELDGQDHLRPAARATARGGRGRRRTAAARAADPARHVSPGPKRGRDAGNGCSWSKLETARGAQHGSGWARPGETSRGSMCFVQRTGSGAEGQLGRPGTNTERWEGGERRTHGKIWRGRRHCSFLAPSGLRGRACEGGRRASEAAESSHRLAQGLLGVLQACHVRPAHVGLLRQNRALPMHDCVIGRG